MLAYIGQMMLYFLVRQNETCMECCVCILTLSIFFFSQQTLLAFYVINDLQMAQYAKALVNV